jgi:hypothetical protein
MKSLNSKEIVFHVVNLNFKLVYSDSPMYSFFYLSKGDQFLSNIKRKNAFAAMRILYKKYGVHVEGDNKIFQKVN